MFQLLPVWGVSDGLPSGAVYSERVLHTERQEQPQLCAVQGKQLCQQQQQQHAQWGDVSAKTFLR